MNIKPKTYFLEPKSGRYYEEFVDGLDQNYKEVVDIESYQALLEQAERMAEALDELTILMEYIRVGQYDPDSFTTQPAKQALQSWQEFKK